MESLDLVVPPILVECYRCGKDDDNIGYVPAFRSMHQIDICVALPHCADCYLELRRLMKTHGQVQEMYGKTRYTYTGNAYAHVLIVIEPYGGSEFATRTQSVDRAMNKYSEHHRHLMAVSDNYRSCYNIRPTKLDSRDPTDRLGSPHTGPVLPISLPAHLDASVADGYCCLIVYTWSIPPHVTVISLDVRPYPPALASANIPSGVPTPAVNDPPWYSCDTRQSIRSSSGYHTAIAMSEYVSRARGTASLLNILISDPHNRMYNFSQQL